MAIVFKTGFPIRRHLNFIDQPEWQPASEWELIVSMKTGRI